MHSNLNTMKTEHLVEGQNVIWINNVEFATTQEENLPVIGTCQLSTIFSNLDTTNKLTTQLPISDNGTLAICNDPRIPLCEPDISNFIVLKDDMGIVEDPSKTTKIEKMKLTDDVKDNFEDMLYFACNLCPFLCTKDTKITEHLAVAHKNKTKRKLVQLKCPACKNIFYHKISLRSHLVHDHGVSNSDLSRIIQAVAFYANENNKPANRNRKQKNKKIDKPEQEIETKTLVPEDNLSDNDKDNDDLHNNEDVPETGDDDEILNKTENGILLIQEKPEERPVALPQFDITHTTEKIFNTMIHQVTTYVDDKTIHRCIMPHCKVHMHDANKMNYHIKSHHDDAYRCLECNEVFSFWKPLSSHLWRIHKVDMELYSCDKCDYKTYSLGKLNNVHKLIHGDVKAYSCSSCDKAFKNAKQLRNHMSIHNKKNKVAQTCNICSKEFSDKRQLNIHMDVVHKKIKPFLCSYCGYKGSSRGSLKMHIRQHTGEKPFSCDQCLYETSDHNSLRRHKLRHTGHKPYKCSFCSYACIQSSTYKVHLKTKHPGLGNDLIFTCEECSFRTVNREKYTAHVVTTHKSKDT